MDIRISCDDGDKLDLRVAEILNKYGFKGIFYIAPYNQKVNILNVREIQELARDQEIGGHTLNHALLTKLTKEQAFKEVFEGKRELEALIGRKVRYFAPPKGWFNENIKEVVKDAGFSEMRTMKQGVIDISSYDKYEIPITVHFHPEHKNNWRRLFKEAYKQNGYFHVTCHGYELEKFNLWDEYEQMISFIRTFIDNNNPKG